MAFLVTHWQLQVIQLKRVQEGSTLFFSMIDAQLWQEQYQERIRDLEQQKLLRSTGPKVSFKLTPARTAAHWLGRQMVRWGAKLQSYDAPAPSTGLSGQT